MSECKNKVSEANWRVEAVLSYFVYFAINASAAVLIENILVKIVALTLLALGVVALLRSDSKFAEAITLLTFIFTFFGAGLILYGILLQYTNVVSTNAYQYFTLSVIAAYSSLVVGLIFGLPLAECCAVRECHKGGDS